MKNVIRISVSLCDLTPQKYLQLMGINTIQSPRDCQSRPFLGVFCNYSGLGQPHSQDKEASFATGGLS